MATAAQRAWRKKFAAMAKSGKFRKGKKKKAGAVKRKRKAPKTKFRQTKPSSPTYSRKIDEQRHAKRPGKRHAKKSGKVYYERRKDRSDVPFALAGIGKVPVPSVTVRKIKAGKYDIIVNGASIGTRRTKSLAKKAQTTIRNRAKSKGLADFKRINGIN